MEFMGNSTDGIPISISLPKKLGHGSSFWEASGISGASSLGVPIVFTHFSRKSLVVPARLEMDQGTRLGDLEYGGTPKGCLV